MDIFAILMEEQSLRVLEYVIMLRRELRRCLDQRERAPVCQKTV